MARGSGNITAGQTTSTATASGRGMSLSSRANWSGDVSDGRMPFYGGRLIASYVGGNHDTYGWKMTIESRPFLVK